jgi:hypothetical protein
VPRSFYNAKTKKTKQKQKQKTLCKKSVHKWKMTSPCQEESYGCKATSQWDLLEEKKKTSLVLLVLDISFENSYRAW